MIFDFALVGLTWLFILGFLILTATMVSDVKPMRDKDIEEGIKSRGELND